MLFIDPDDSKVNKAKTRFLKAIKPKVLKNLNDLESLPFNKTLLKKWIISDLDRILVGRPGELENLRKKYKKIHASRLLRADLSKIFDYDWFITKRKSYCAYHLAQDLEVNTCVYCNRNYTNTVINKEEDKIIRPQFDHFIDKAVNPLFRLSFFNLIPCCSTCNSNLKGSTPFNIDTHLHPYNDKVLSDFSFSYEYSEKEGELEILIKPDSLPAKIKESFDDFKIRDIYNAHTSEVKDLIYIKEAFSDNYLSILSSEVLKGVEISQKEMYRIAFGTYYEDEKLHSRPFSKLKRDILQELKIKPKDN